MVRACSTHEKLRDAYNVSVEKPERKRPLGRPEHRWDDNIMIEIRKVERRGMDWISLAYDRTSGRLL
jgi:hypothetical protein